MTREDAPSKRSWYRLHGSTWTALVLATAVLVLLIAPGELSEDWGFFPSKLRHGWPWIYLSRRTGLPGYKEGAPPWLIGGGWSWSVEPKLRSETNPSFSLPMLLADLAVAGGILLLLAVALESWRRRRTRLLQIHLSDIAAATLMLGLLLGWWHLYYRRHVQAEQALQALSQGDASKFERVFWSYAGPDWLRKLVGHASLPPEFDSVSLLRWSVAPGELRRAVPVLERLANLRLLGVEGASDADVQLLVGLQQLEFLELPGSEEAPHTDAALPPLAQMTNLRYLALWESEVTDKGILQLRSLTRLETLDFGQSPRLTEPGVKALRRALPDCWITGVVEWEQ